MPRVRRGPPLFAWAATTFFRASVLASVLKTRVATVAYFVLVALAVFLLALPQVLAAVRDVG